MFIIIILSLISTVMAMENPAIHVPSEQEHHTITINIDQNHTTIDVETAQKLDTEYIETEKISEDCKKRNCNHDKKRLAIIGAVTTLLTTTIGGVVALIIHFTK